MSEDTQHRAELDISIVEQEEVTLSGVTVQMPSYEDHLNPEFWTKLLFQLPLDRPKDTETLTFALAAGQLTHSSYVVPEITIEDPLYENFSDIFNAMDREFDLEAFKDHSHYSFIAALIGLGYLNATVNEDKRSAVFSFPKASPEF